MYVPTSFHNRGISPAGLRYLRELLDGGRKIRSEGCQGVRANVRPALVYEEGTPLVAGKARATIEGHPAFEVTLVLPVLEEL